MHYDLPKQMSLSTISKADSEIRAQHEKGIFDEGDPNHPEYNHGVNYTRLFGYDKKEFLKKQYK